MGTSIDSVCEHGGLRRSCEICELRAEIELLRSQREVALQSRDRHQKRSQYLDGAVIELRAEIERLNTHTRCPQCDQLRLEAGELRARLTKAGTALDDLRCEAGSWTDGCGCCASGKALSETDEWKALEAAVRGDQKRT